MNKYLGSLAIGFLASSSCLAVEDKIIGTWLSNEDGVVIKLVFGPDKQVRSIANAGTMSGTYTVDYSKAPHHLDICWTVAGEELKVAAIIEFKGNDEFRLSAKDFNKPRPTDFTVKVGILHRAKPIPAEKRP